MYGQLATSTSNSFFYISSKVDFFANYVHESEAECMLCYMIDRVLKGC